jgi:hypothetical protein
LEPPSQQVDLSVGRKLDSAFRSDQKFCDGRVVHFHRIVANGPYRLVETLLQEFQPYAASDQTDFICLEKLIDGDLSFLRDNHASGCMVAFDSRSAVIRRVKFHFYGPGCSPDATLYFRTSNLSPAADAREVLSEIARFATMLGTETYSVHEETNSEWQVGDFSEATLLFESTTIS